MDDLDGTDLGDKANTITFAFEGKDYSIDLSDANADTFREVLEPYINAGHRVAGSKAKTSRRTTTSANESKRVRDWARSNGYDVSDRGRIPAEVMQAYTAAN
ncbi:Lsr2 family protein [Dietzia sp. NCCP-2495]|uniref:histone-like nucleoid-structuring protein Lsr2 n=1 Tax=Dietzia sp. NCCP-2495 TaxID=2934675 RepID=UPI0022308520|nr:Lsr2 family protein [Dietzia sp. NCCP-2495]